MQLHGDESAATVARGLERSLPVIKAIRVQAPFRASQLARYKKADALLLDVFDSKPMGRYWQDIRLEDREAGRSEAPHISGRGLDARQCRPGDSRCEALRRRCVQRSGSKTREKGPGTHESISPRGERRTTSAYKGAKGKLFVLNGSWRRGNDEFDCTSVHRILAGRYGPYGGRYVPETLMAPLQELEQAYAEARSGLETFKAELDTLCFTTSPGDRRHYNLRRG